MSRGLLVAVLSALLGCLDVALALTGILEGASGPASIAVLAVGAAFAIASAVKAMGSGVFAVFSTGFDDETYAASVMEESRAKRVVATRLLIVSLAVSAVGVLLGGEAVVGTLLSILST